ncbi:hypothetical protein NJH54_13925 [Pseudomonas asiatica]|nr:MULTISPECIES: hypothetical protein [Pseudomonas]MCO7525601.1 hypothetical protein [Pseudomonas asiatica]MDH4430633.1 hypothetical protein [Pseudomonas shirazica]
MVGLLLPDGNRLSFKYDEFARLLAKAEALSQMTEYPPR